MTLANLKKIAGAFHASAAGSYAAAVAAMTVDSLDLFLVAANNAKNNAQLLHNFELSRVKATLDIDGETGGALSNAIITGGDATSLVVTGTLSPDVTGVYKLIGVDYNGNNVWVKNSPIAGMLSYVETGWSLHRLNDVTLASWFRGVVETVTPAGSYSAISPATGTATVALGTSAFSGIREIIAVSRSGADGILTPLDFTRADVAIERERYAIELDEEYGAYNRYRSDAALLDLGSSGTLTQRGNSLYVFPLDTVSSSPLSVAIEAYGQLADYVTADLSDTEPSDFLIEHGAVYMQWAIICELNFLFKTFTPRTEGNLAPPETARDNAWRDLLLWDTYMVDSHSTRSR